MNFKNIFICMLMVASNSCLLSIDWREQGTVVALGALGTVAATVTIRLIFQGLPSPSRHATLENLQIQTRNDDSLDDGRKQLAELYALCQKEHLKQEPECQELQRLQKGYMAALVKNNDLRTELFDLQSKK